MNKRPKISVAVITYNQEDTIAQTIDSILMQKGDFNLELVIGEDCSSDNTLAICREYEAKYVGVVRVLSGPYNLGITPNYARTLCACTGEYIADIAGDDYYCDEYAIEKQLRYMQSHPEVGVMGANGYSYLVRKNKMIPRLNQPVDAENGDISQYFFSPAYRGGPFFRPVGILMRSELLKYIDFDEFIRRELPVEDYPMQAIWSQYTRFACLPDLLVVYRVYRESATHIGPEHPKYLWYHRGLMNIRRYLNELFPDNVVFDEAFCRDYELYKEFLLYTYRLDYQSANKIVQKWELDSRNYKQAKRMTSNVLIFVCFALYKIIMNKRKKIGY